MNYKSLVTVVIPAFNEASLITDTLAQVSDYLDTLKNSYDWEIIVINDGSSDNTAELINAVSAEHAQIHSVHHSRNMGLGNAFKTGFKHAKGDYIVTFDADLSYAPSHIESMLSELIQTGSNMVVASPYMEGGEVINVPWKRKTLSIYANRFLSYLARTNLSTVTGMVRAYDASYIKKMNLKGEGMNIMPEMVYKSIILGGKMSEVPGTLDWTNQRERFKDRKSNMKIGSHVKSTMVSGLLFKPFEFFVFPGALLLLFALYTNTWMFIHYFNAYVALPPEMPSKFTEALDVAFVAHPHTYFFGVLSLMLSIQMMSLAVLSLQNKKYYEELFHMGTSIISEVRDTKDDR